MPSLEGRVALVTGGGRGWISGQYLPVNGGNNTVWSWRLR